jgi:predicted esterase
MSSIILNNKKKRKPILTSFVILALSLLIGLVYSALPESKIIKPIEKHEATVIFLHGLGDRAKSWQNILQPISEKYPTVKFIFPQAPITMVNMNFYLPMPAWYNLKGKIDDLDNLKGNSNQLIKQVEKISQLVRSEIDLAVDPQKIIVMGHSQGGSVALVFGLTSDIQIRKIVSLAGFLLNNWKEEIELEKNPQKKNKFTLYHGRHDDLVPFWAGERTNKFIQEKNYESEFKEVKSHWFNINHIFPVHKVKEIMEKELDNLLAKS